MVKSRKIRTVLLLALIGTLLIALVEPIAADSMDQTNKMKSSTDKQTNMMPCMTEDHAGNGTMEHDSSSGTMMHCHCMMMGDHAGDGMMGGMMGNHQANESMMPCMMSGENSANENMMCMMGMMDQNASMSKAGPECTRFWLLRAIAIHEMHLKFPSTMTEESNMMMMDQMKQAYKCDTGKDINENMTAGMKEENLSKSQNMQDCTSFWLLKAIKLHDLHMKSPKEEANESSQMLLMNQMIQAYDCIPVNNTPMGGQNACVIAQARLTCADFWLQKAIELHEIHLDDPSTANEESQIEMMNQMMLAQQCIKGEKMNAEMMDIGMTNATGSDATDNHASGGH